MEKRFQQSSLASFRRQSLPCRRQLINKIVNRIVRAREADTNEKVRPKSRGGGGGDSAYERGGDARRKF